MRGEFHAWRRAVVLAAVGLIVAAGTAEANAPLTRVSSDPYTNPTSQHATELEPDTFAHHGTVVSAFQVGRFFDGGASDIGVVRSGDGSATWNAPGFLHDTFNSGNASSPYERVSDASVAYDAAHGVWIVSSIPILPNGVVPTVLFNRSTDDGRSWGPAISMPPPVSNSVNLDKNWTACDNHPSSPFYGHCYTELDNFGVGDLELMSTSTDGGRTWSVPIRTDGNDKGLGGQPVVQPSGRVVVPFESLNGTISAFHSDNGGASWSRGFKVSGISFHGVAGGLRTSPLPTAEIAGDGTIYVAWEDCRFREEVPGQRHRVLEVIRRSQLDRSGPRADRPGDEQRRPLHPGPGRRPDHLRHGHAPGTDLLLLSQRQLRWRVPARRGLHLVSGRRRPLG